jgi:MFS family permease
MAKDLDLDSERKSVYLSLWAVLIKIGYAWVISIFFFGYLLCEVPSNMVLSRTRPSIFLPAIMIVWGALSAALACVHNYPSILAFRFILGCIESGFFPGVLFVMSCWYTTAEIGTHLGFIM